MEDARLESAEQAEDKKAVEPPEKEVKDREAIKPPQAQLKIEKAIETPEAGLTSIQEELEVKKESRTSSAEQDLDEFLLGDMEDIDDDGPGTAKLVKMLEVCLFSGEKRKQNYTDIHPIFYSWN